MRTQLVVFSLSRRAQKRLMESVGAVQDYVLLSARGLRALFTRPRYPKELLAQMDSLGVGSLSIERPLSASSTTNQAAVLVTRWTRAEA